MAVFQAGHWILSYTLIFVVDIGYKPAKSFSAASNLLMVHCPFGCCLSGIAPHHS